MGLSREGAGEAKVSVAGCPRGVWGQGCGVELGRRGAGEAIAG